MSLFPDNVKFCAHCGQRVSEEKSRCPRCGRVARVPLSALLAVLGLGGVAAGAWAAVKGASALLAVLSGLSSALLLFALLRVLLRNPSVLSNAESFPVVGDGYLLHSAHGAVLYRRLLGCRSRQRHRGFGVQRTPDCSCRDSCPGRASVHCRSTAWMGGVQSLSPIAACGAGVSPRSRYCGICGESQSAFG